MIKKPKSKSLLLLNKQTVSNLNRQYLQKVRGGYPTQIDGVTSETKYCLPPSPHSIECVETIGELSGCMTDIEE